MNDVGKEYGAALFMLACEADKKREYAAALKRIRECFAEDPDYEVFLSSPSISRKHRLSAIETAFSDCVPEDVLSFLMLLCEKGRMDCFSVAVEEYNALLDHAEHISNAKVTSAEPLTETEKAKLKKKLELVYKGEVHIEYFTDKDLIGGLVVEVDGSIMDGSLRQRLRDVKDVMSL